jgi:hypothetical protein
MYKAVEVAQQKVRAPEPAVRPARHSLEAQPDSPPLDFLSPIAQELVGKTGLIAFRVVDVARNDQLKIFQGAPRVVTERRAEFPYLVVAECDNPTATYLSAAQRREMQQNTQAGRSATTLAEDIQYLVTSA